MMCLLLLLTALAASVSLVAADIPPSCSKPVYCNSSLLHHVQLAHLFPDSKTFVDMEMVNDPNATLDAFQKLLDQTNNNPSKEELKGFVDEYFMAANELEMWRPTDYSENPKFLVGVKDESLRQFGKNINEIWPTLGRKVKSTVFDNPDRFSLIPVSHGFIIPGGRFKELYYWDAYWIVEGLLISEMHETVKGMLENFIELLKTIGHIPNGSRWYYQERSQPPLLTAMVSLYISETNDRQFLKANIDSLEEELYYWLNSQTVTFDKDGQTYTLLRYYVPSEGPRPESYREDYLNAQLLNGTKERQTEFYIDIKSAAESGWDFSSRWFISKDGNNGGNLTSIHSKYIVPVDLNAIFANALQSIAYFHSLLQNPHKAARWAGLAKQWRSNIDNVLWDEEAGVWFDYDLSHNTHRKFFYPSNVAPLWMGAVDKNQLKERSSRVLRYLQLSKGLDFPGGVPASLNETGEQWDFPNAWPPLVSIVVNALEALGSEEGSEQAFYVAQTWVRSCYQGFINSGNHMFEKYNVEKPGVGGDGGEYDVQVGFGWSNGVVLEFLAKYGNTLTAYDSAEDEKADEGSSQKLCDGSRSDEESSKEVIPLTKN